MAGATLATAAPMSAWAKREEDSIGAINTATFLHIVDRGLNHGDLSVIDENVSPDMVEHQIYGVNWPTGPAAIKALVTTLRTAFPDLYCHIIDVSTAGDKVFGRAITTGSFTGNYLGVPGNGNKIYIEIHDEFRFLSHAGMDSTSRPKIIEHWGVADNLTLLIQLGLIPYKDLPAYKG